ncbi:glycosyltransferase family 2 protein [Ruegeria aquimaris]|uniref:Glycosyltransferase n=1 Tax=Ruegeria aquimaris TaxID=2984333 RepID=A0ABT3ADW0_9RHOB|nr:glycosyltransferase [Ruegeria sp. XHP0148]MCV2886860.1 glycosyltransferase [Ruegeria sp. XHP0148]
MPSPTVTVGVATANRPQVVAELIRYLASLSDAPDRVMLSISDAKDVDPTSFPEVPFQLEVIRSEKGSCAQRNAILKHERDRDIVLFLDDDYLIADGFLTELRQLFTEHSNVVLATGRVVEDGARGPGLDFSEGLRILRSASTEIGGNMISDVRSAYGCNMALRLPVSGEPVELFDETLPLYGWLEDLDFSRRVARRGRVIRADTLVGVHLGTKIGRTKGKMLGYSQIANPIYLCRKGTVGWPHALRLMTRNILANLVGSLRPAPWVDRRGRLHGNFIALADLAQGRSSPTRILDFRYEK